MNPAGTAPKTDCTGESNRNLSGRQEYERTRDTTKKEQKINRGKIIHCNIRLQNVKITIIIHVNLKHTITILTSFKFYYLTLL
jgi:hypothetical protein